METPSHKNGAIVAALADAAEQLASAEELSGIAAVTMRCVSRLLSCSAVSFSAFDLRTLQPLCCEHLTPNGHLCVKPSLERSRNLAASLAAGAQLLTAADGSAGEYFFLSDCQSAGHLPPCELRLPFFRYPDTLCVLTLGKKNSGTDYNPEDIDILRILIALLSGPAQSPFMAKASRPHGGCSGSLTSYQRRVNYARLMGSSAQMLAIKEKIAQIAPTDAAVLINGESGTGKELAARAIHQLSRQSSRDMVIVNCAAMPEQLAESELFGHERGAFTGALSLKKGKFEFADHSTLFLDEIGDLSPVVQAKLLRFLQDGVFQRVGGNQNLRSQVRLISATNKDLPAAIEEGAFRSDLYYRINVVQIELPPLREHREDILPIAEHYARYFAGKYGKEHRLLHPAIVDRLQNYSFPGNVRELINIIERVIILGNGPAALATLPIPRTCAPPASFSAHQSLDALEKEYIRSLLKETGHNKSETARILGIARKTLREKMAKYCLN